MGRKSQMKKLKANKKASKKAKESEIKIPPPQKNENFFKLKAEENTAAPAAEGDDSDIETKMQNGKRHQIKLQMDILKEKN